MTTRAAVLVGTALAALGWSRDAAAFKPEGHVVLEVMAYRELGTGDGREALETLLRDGALEAPICFWNRSDDCIQRFESDPLAWWPAPHTDAADLVVARQFSHAGQCFHYMAEQDDEEGAHWVDPMNPRDPHVSYGLMWDAYFRCNDQLERILWRIVQNPVEARKNARGLYELMHAVMDSYSHAHTERDYVGWRGDTDPKIEFLKIWQPTVGNPLAESSRSTRHEIFEIRDEHFIEPTHEEGGKPCTSYVATPYGMPVGCLSVEGRLAASAVEDLLRLVARLRVARATRKDVHAGWQSFVARHLAHAETLGPDPTRLLQRPAHEDVPFVFLGVREQALPTESVWDSTLFGRYVVSSGTLDPLTLAVQVEAGTRHDFAHDTERFLVRQDLDASLTLGTNVTFGVTPFSVDFATGHGQPDRFETVSRAVRVDWFEPLHGTRMALSFWGPGEYSWLDHQLRWSGGIGLSGGLLEHSPALTHRTYGPRHPAGDASEVAWYPPYPWDSEIRSSSGPLFLGAYLGATSDSGAYAGKVREGLELAIRKRNWWGALNPLSLGFLLESDVEFTQDLGPHTSFGAFATGRWYVLKPFGLLADVGVNTLDVSPSHLHPWSFQSRYGVVLSISRVDLIVESPTLPRTDWVNGEILSARLALEGWAL